MLVGPGCDATQTTEEIQKRSLASQNVAGVAGQRREAIALRKTLAIMNVNCNFHVGLQSRFDPRQQIDAACMPLWRAII